MKNTVKFSVVMSIALKDWLDTLAKKEGITRNKLIVSSLTRVSRLKPLDIDLVKPGNRQKKGGDYEI